MCFTGQCQLKPWPIHLCQEAANEAKEALLPPQVSDPDPDAHHHPIAPRLMASKVCNANLNRRGVKMLSIMSCDFNRIFVRVRMPQTKT